MKHYRNYILLWIWPSDLAFTALIEAVTSALQAMTLYKLFESKVVLNVRGTWYFLRGTWYFAQNRMLVVMAGSGEAQKPYF